MNKFTKISATALFALFLTACDKPADKAPDAKPEAAAQTQSAPATAEAAKADETADYKKLVDWNKSQEQTQLQAQQKFQQDLVAAVQAKDDKKVQETIDVFNKSVQNTIASLDALNISSDSVKAVKEQTRNVLGLASNLLVEQANVSLANPTPEQQKTYMEKAEKLRDAMLELQKQSVALEQKFNPAPAAPTAEPAAPAQESK
ncbi:lipoprotein HlpB [Aggregatibacter actinomycetemcomitans]|uniref:lipoprotein HlpB n=1 Tax=Aggregatibacter actinomycetemcomitans TaxID=714 RepID=UPI0011D2EDF7|nr:lipoprotein HlpB [Aggregatibacter actinomycetemcomitans]QEH45672.1 lipoprotein HlpB [Aggregatibacter actinomycetemcomitans]QEH47587.1 lipoprotein HlpB [Aggregatibacter actinomycetemcomitans]QEH49404.1 lipoprotein HlpB [Aggregatibacter actinomycetemcomitans]TYA48452.1 lipoprotein HlpB [Aggregatibacter actinomycetemcomitans]TYA51237.1 lipoprotein HlpB [Aggregatibacter actinomycetemcomitans]